VNALMMMIHEKHISHSSALEQIKNWLDYLEQEDTPIQQAGAAKIEKYNMEERSHFSK
jgi:hypothetical protein